MSPRNLRPRARWALACAAVVVAGVVGAAAWADTITPDADTVNAGDQTSRNLGVVSPGATVTPQTSFNLVCAGNKHVDNGQTVNLTFDLAGSTVPAGGSMSATNASIGPMPSTWPDDATGSPNCGTTTTFGDNGNSVVTITAPTTQGTYMFTAKWSKSLDPAGTNDSSSLSGPDPTATYTLTVEAAPTVTGTTPANGATDVALDANVVLTFSEPVAVSGSWFTISCGTSGTHAAGVSGSGSSRTLDPTVDFAYGETCTVTVVAANVTDTDTNDPPDTMASDHVFSFSTPAPPNTPPSVVVTGVADGATYDKGAVPAAGCSVTDAEDGPSTPAPSVGSVTGPYAADGIGSQTVTCSYTDGGGLSGSATATYTIVDPSPPAISYVLSPASPDGSGGWYVSDVSLSWTVSEPESPSSLAKTGCVDQSVTADQAETTYSCSATSAGGSAGPVDVTVKRDATKPSLAVADTPDGANGWNTTAPVTVAVTAGDALSGLAGTPSCNDGGTALVVSGAAPDFTVGVAGDGTHTVECTATDAAGNSRTSSDEVKIDTTKPSASAAVSPAANGNGWHTVDVTVSYSGTDGLSGVDFCDADDVLSTEGAGQSASGTCTDKAGNVSDPAEATGISIDKTAPVITFSSRTPANGNGWNNGDVTVEWSCSDGLSGVVSATVSETVNTEGENQSATGTCEDLAGNSASDTQTDISIDKSAPVITFSSRTPANGNGWNNGDVTVDWTCSDGLSGAVSATVSKTVSTEGENQSATGTCEDLAGNSASDTQNGISIDKTKPSASAAVSPAANGNGWHRVDVTVSYSGADGPSGVDFCDADDVLSGEGAGQSASGTCTDKAGNVSDPAEANGISIDKTAPAITFSTRTAANGNGWNNTDVTVEWSCSDGLSGPVSATVSQTVSTEGENQSATGTCEDLAGNSASDTQNGISIDKTDPGIAFDGQSPGKNSHGWNNANVALGWSCTDTLSGVVSGSVSVLVTTEGENQQRIGTCEDIAGNSASSTDGDVDLDKTNPGIAFAGQSPPKNGHGWNKTDVTLGWTCTDALSGPVDATLSELVSSEGENQARSATCDDRAGNSSSSTDGDVDLDKTAPTLTWNGGPANGASYFFGFVPAAPTCTPADDLSGPDGCGVTGHGTTVGSHTMTATAHDKAGNETTETRTYTVAAWTLTGFYQPVDMNGVYNTVKNGSTVPLKFELFAGTTELTDTASVKSLTYAQTACNATATTDDIETVATGGTVLRYDSTGGQFVYNWKTPATAGKCYRVTMTTQDGSSLVAFFKLK